MQIYPQSSVSASSSLGVGGRRDAGATGAVSGTGSAQVVSAGALATLVKQDAELAKAAQQLRAEPDVRPDAVAAAKAKLEQGYYNTRTAAVQTADAMVGGMV